MQAEDIVLVAKVRVKILNSEGNALEEGEARQVSSSWWEYSSRTKGTIEALAWDQVVIQ